MLVASPLLPNKDYKDTEKEFLLGDQEGDFKPIKEGKQEKAIGDEEEIVALKAQGEKERMSQAQGDREGFDFEKKGLEVYTGATLLQKGSGFKPKNFYQALAHVLPRGNLEQLQKEMQATLAALGRYFEEVDSLSKKTDWVMNILFFLWFCSTVSMIFFAVKAVDTLASKLSVSMFVVSGGLLLALMYLISHNLDRLENNISQLENNDSQVLRDAKIKYKKLMERLISLQALLVTQGLHSYSRQVQQYLQICLTPIHSKDAYYQVSELEKEIQLLLSPVPQKTPWYASLWKKKNHPSFSPSTLEAGRLRFVS